ncbi:HAD family hydrolase [Halobacteriales archaeon Cl-PHB]
MAGREYDFWLFDLDGTVVDIEEAYVHDVIGEVGDRLGREFSDREAELLWYGIGDGRDRLLADFGVSPERFWTTFHRVEDPIARAEATYLYDDAAALVPERSEPVGVVTHCQQYLTDPVLEHLDIGDWFDTVVCCDEDTGWKPDPEPVEQAMSDLGVGYNGHRGVLVGDDPTDVGAAWNAGIDAAHVERHDPDRVGLSVMGDHRVTSLTDFET